MFTSSGKQPPRSVKKLLHIDDDRGRLHCDSVTCGHVLKEALPWGAQLIGYPCPACGDNMLTAEDYAASERMFAMVAWINRWFGWLGNAERPPAAGDVSIGIRNHAGKVILDGPKQHRATAGDQ